MSKWAWGFWAVETVSDMAGYIAAEKVTTGNTSDPLTIAAIGTLALAKLVVEPFMAHKWYKEEKSFYPVSSNETLKTLGAGAFISILRAGLSITAGWQAGVSCEQGNDCLNPGTFKSPGADAVFSAEALAVVMHAGFNTYKSLARSNNYLRM